MASKQLLQAVPALPFGLSPREEVGVHNLHSLASWVSLVAAARGGDWLPVQELIVDLYLSTKEERPAPVHIWQAVHRQLRSVEVHGVLNVLGLGCPVDARPGEFAGIGRSICREILGFTSLVGMAMDMCFQGEPFFLPLEGCYDRLSYLAIANLGRGDVVLSLGSMPHLESLSLYNLGVGGYVTAMERLQRLSILYVGGGCPRFLDIAHKFDGVGELFVIIRTPEPKDGFYGGELRGLSALAELPALENVRFHLQPRSPIHRDLLHPRVLSPHGEVVAFVGVAVDYHGLE